MYVVYVCSVGGMCWCGCVHVHVTKEEKPKSFVGDAITTNRDKNKTGQDRPTDTRPVRLALGEEGGT